MHLSLCRKSDNVYLEYALIVTLLVENMKYIILFVLITSSFTVFADWQQPELSHNLTEIKKVIPAKDFELQDMDEQKIRLSDYKGKVILLNFWATWCPPCRAEMPLMQEYAEANQGDFVVLAVNVGEEKLTIENFVTNQNFDDLIFLLDPTNSVVNLYRISGFPTSLFIDSEGMLQGAYIGEMSRDLLIQYLAKIGVK